MDKVISIYNHQYKDQRGVVALLASIIIGILLVLITVSGIVLMSTEVRQATDFDQSVKAYYAAETGVEDALAEIKRRIDGGETLADILSGGTEACSNFLGSGPNPNNISGDPNATVSYTCQVVELAGNEINGVLDVEEAVQIDLSGANFNKLEIHWNQQGLDAPNLFGVPLTFPAGSSWGNFPAVLETRVISFPSTGTFNAGAIGGKVFVLKPHNSDSPAPAGRINYNPAPDPLIKNLACNPAPPGGYNCMMEINFAGGPGSTNYILRMKPKYYRGTTHYSVRAFQGGTPADIPSGQLAIDVTAKAGDIFRRVRVQVPIGVQPDSVLDYVILSDDDICKYFSVSRVADSASTETGCE